MHRRASQFLHIRTVATTKVRPQVSLDASSIHARYILGAELPEEEDAAKHEKLESRISEYNVARSSDNSLNAVQASSKLSSVR